MASTTPPEDEANRLLTTVGLFMEAHAGLSAEFERHLAANGAVTGQPFEILLRLKRTPGQRMRMSDLAAQTTLTASGLTRAVDRLQRDGMVVREACSEDRRVSYAALTEAGNAEICRALPVHVAHIAQIFGQALSDDDVVELERIMRQLRDTLNPAAACASLPGGTPEKNPV